MLTSLYYPKEILKSLLSGVPTSLPGGFNSCSFFMGLIGKWADHVNLPVTVISEAFGVTPQAVYGNINRLAQLEAKPELMRNQTSQPIASYSRKRILIR